MGSGTESTGASGGPGGPGRPITGFAARPGRGWPVPPKAWVGGGCERITSDFGNCMSSQPPTHALKFSLLPALKFLFSKEKENAKLHPLLQRIGALVSHSGGKCHLQGPTPARPPAQLCVHSSHGGTRVGGALPVSGSGAGAGSLPRPPPTASRLSPGRFDEVRSEMWLDSELSLRLGWPVRGASSGPRGKALRPWGEGPVCVAGAGGGAGAAASDPGNRVPRCQPASWWAPP